MNIVERVEAYRKLAAADSAAEAKRLGLSQEEKKTYMFDADSNAIWDAQAGLPYIKFPYKKTEAPGPAYTELGFLNDEEYKKIMGKERS